MKMHKPSLEHDVGALNEVVFYGVRAPFSRISILLANR